jgi:hypothetical protein
MEERTVEDILKECLESEGYVTFMACVKKGRVQHYYNRSYMSFEDTKRALTYFKKHIEDDEKQVESQLPE